MERRIQKINDKIEELSAEDPEKALRNVIRYRFRNLRNRRGLFLILRKNFRLPKWSKNPKKIWKILMKSAIKRKLWTKKRDLINTKQNDYVEQQIQDPKRQLFLNLQQKSINVSPEQMPEELKDFYARGRLYRERHWKRRGEFEHPPPGPPQMGNHQSLLENKRGEF